MKDMKYQFCLIFRWPQLSDIAGKLVEVYLVLSSGQHGDPETLECSQCASLDLTSTKTSGRFVSVRDMIKWCSRIDVHIQNKELNVRAFQVRYLYFRIKKL